MSNKCQTQPNITRCTSSESFIFILCVICDWLQCPTALFAYVTILNNNNIKYRVGKKYQETDHQIFSIITKKSITQFWSSMLNYMQSLMMLITHDTTLRMAIKPPPTMFKCQHAHCMHCCLLELMHTTVAWMHATLTTLLAATIVRQKLTRYHHYAQFKTHTTNDRWERQLIRLT